MKKILFVFAISLFTLASCTPDKTPEEEQNEFSIEKDKYKPPSQG